MFKQMLILILLTLTLHPEPLFCCHATREQQETLETLCEQVQSLAPHNSPFYEHLKKLRNYLKKKNYLAATSIVSSFRGMLVMQLPALKQTLKSGKVPPQQQKELVQALEHMGNILACLNQLETILLQIGENTEHSSNTSHARSKSSSRKKTSRPSKKTRLQEDDEEEDDDDDPSIDSIIQKVREELREKK